jgi:hypothetical protein
VRIGGPATHTIIDHISDAESLGSITTFIKEQLHHKRYLCDI